MNSEELKNNMSQIYDKMRQEASSKAFISNLLVNEWSKELEKLTSQINDFGEPTKKKYVENGLEFCMTCGQKVSLKRRRIEKSMILALLKAIHYCRSKGLKTFHKKDVSTLNPVEYTLLAFLPKFGLLYKRDNMIPGEFGIPYKICAEFFHGKRSVLEYYEIDPTKKEGEEGYKINSESRIFFKDIPKHSELVAQFPSTIEYLGNTNFD